MTTTRPTTSHPSPRPAPQPSPARVPTHADLRQRPAAVDDRREDAEEIEEPGYGHGV